ncbi:hypothetical protein GCM10022221_35740 [Actinocorallia aurea]
MRTAPVTVAHRPLTHWEGRRHGVREPPGGRETIMNARKLIGGAAAFRVAHTAASDWTDHDVLAELVEG